MHDSLVSIPSHLKLTSHMLFLKAQGEKNQEFGCVCAVYAISVIKSELIPYIRAQIQTTCKVIENH